VWRWLCVWVCEWVCVCVCEWWVCIFHVILTTQNIIDNTSTRMCFWLVCVSLNTYIHSILHCWLDYMKQTHRHNTYTHHHTNINTHQAHTHFHQHININQDTHTYTHSSHTLRHNVCVLESLCVDKCVVVWLCVTPTLEPKSSYILIHSFSLINSLHMHTLKHTNYTLIVCWFVCVCWLSSNNTYNLITHTHQHI